MPTRHEYRVTSLPVVPHGGGSLISYALDLGRFERLLNEQGADGFEFTTMNVQQKMAVFQRDVYEERGSKEHIETVLAAVKSYGDVHDLEFMLVADNPLSDGPFPPRAVSDDEAWRFLINRILQES